MVTPLPGPGDLLTWGVIERECLHQQDCLDRVGHAAEFGVFSVPGNGGQSAEAGTIIRGAVVLQDGAVCADLIQRQLEAVFATFQPSTVAEGLPSQSDRRSRTESPVAAGSAFTARVPQSSVRSGDRFNLLQQS